MVTTDWFSKKAAVEKKLNRAWEKLVAAKAEYAYLEAEMARVTDEANDAAGRAVAAKKEGK